MERWRQVRSSGIAWALLAVAVSCLPVLGALSNTRIFAVRDLSMYFWPRHQWLRHTVFSGQWPWWDPYLGSGQNAAADALNQLFLVPALLIRLLLPEALGFNLWIALPFPLAAAGMYLFARTQASRRASSLAAIVFAVSGPVLSTGNFPNMSWSTAFIPWVVWAAHRCATRGEGRSVAVLALAFGAQILSGEPVSMTATAIVALAYVMVEAWPAGRAGAAFSAAARTLAGLMLGAALSAVQMIPLLRVSARSPRGAMDIETFWSLHPFNLADIVSPGIFGDYFSSFALYLPWMRALNSGRDPFFYSLYLGVPVLCLAAYGLGVRGLRRNWFWLAVALASIIAALGSYTPIYPAIQALVPPLRTFRFPPKYLVLGVLAVAMLIAAGWDALTDSGQERDGNAEQQAATIVRLRRVVVVGAAFAVIGYLVALIALVSPNAMVMPLAWLADVAHVDQPRLAVSMLLDYAVPHGARLFLMSAAAVCLFYAGRGRGRAAGFARVALFAAITADLLITNAPVNQLISLDTFAKPAWATVVEQHPQQRFYFGGRVAGYMDTDDVDAPRGVSLPAVRNSFEIRATMQALILIMPSGWGLREAVSYDLPVLGSIDYTRLSESFKNAGREARLRFLSRAGTRYCIMPVPPAPDMPALMDIKYLDGLRLYDCDPNATRVRVIPPRGRIEPDHGKQIAELFRKEFDFPGMMLLDREPPPAAGTPGPARPAAARIVRDDASAVDIVADVEGQGGFLLLMDSYDDEWTVDVDGAPAQILLADGLYRAVRLVPGQHTVNFRYKPLSLAYGGLISGVAALGCVMCFVPWRRRSVATTRAEAAMASV